MNLNGTLAFGVWLDILILVLALPRGAVAQPIPAWLQYEQAPLATAAIPECPKHIGSRQFRSNIAQANDTTVAIIATARRDPDGCEQAAEMSITSAGKTRTIRLPSSMKQFDLVDFSKNASQLLLDGRIINKFPNEALDYIKIARLGVSSDHIEWRDVWAVFGWKDCDATVEPEGITPDGRIVALARASIFLPARRRDCISARIRPGDMMPDLSAGGLYVLDLESTKAVRAPETLRIVRYGKVIRTAAATCKGDPDIVGPCFTLHGRLSAGNGTPEIRIWRVGTKRVLGMSEDSTLPESIAGKIHFGAEMFGDFLVCPLTTQEPGVMQTVCVESAANVRVTSP